MIRDKLIEAGLWDANDLRDPAQDISAAWQVVEKMQRQGFNFEITMLSFRNTPALSCAVVISNGKTHHEAHADTAPLAICLAALRAAGEGA